MCCCFFFLVFFLSPFEKETIRNSRPTLLFHTFFFFLVVKVKKNYSFKNKNWNTYIHKREGGGDGDLKRGWSYPDLGFGSSNRETERGRVKERGEGRILFADDD